MTRMKLFHTATFSLIIFFGLTSTNLSANNPSFERDIQQLSIFKNVLSEMFQEMMFIHKYSERNELGYISNIENDRIENLLYRYLLVRKSLWNIIEQYRNYDTLSEDELYNTKAFVIGYYSALMLYKASGHFITINMLEDELIEKLNEPYYKSGIPEGTFDHIFESLTLPDNLDDLDIARELYIRELYEPGTHLNKLKSDSLYIPLISELEELNEFHINHREKILTHFVLLTPEITNQLRHSSIKKRTEYLIDKAGGQFEAIKAFVVTQVGDIKSPVKSPLIFTHLEKTFIKNLLKPGDIILTFSEGYMSNIFLPGIFKHGIMYIGNRNTWTQKDWDTMDISDINKQVIHTGDDIIEAVSEGVISNSILHVLDTKINRLAILRPQLHEHDIKRAIKNAHAYLGNGYDFSFDFNDAGTQVCTEIIYRSYNGLGEISFPLIERVGNMTLSGDDICKYAIDSGQLQIIALIDEDTKKPGTPLITTDSNAPKILRDLLGL
ncbi:MAG: hypothetical protein ISR83_01715 [Candidatus Marinimicrobia bacterium]|nr:hypothetical protein [Candidatus Neomarinimicrobiota bacterium]